VGILLPSSARLWATALAFAAARRVWLSDDPRGLAMVLVAGGLLHWGVGGAGRAWALERALRVLGRGGAGVPWPRVAIVEAVEQATRWGSFLGVATFGMLVGGIALSGGWFALGFAILAVSWIAATAVDLVWQGVFGTALVEVLSSRRGATDALRASARRFAGDVFAQLAIVGVGALAVGVGGLACGAGALPGYPLSDLARLDRWVARSQEHP
jgi:hypothetical protein